ncbi:MAG: TonB-dependent receptor [Prolixibacteraceae bacterium]|nr:TonB-dependent receptor [Prolixibacteraceae bacterium]
MKKVFSLLILLLSFAVLFAQEKSVAGRVTDENSEAIPGVTVVVKGTTKGTITDFNGNFKISVPVGKTVVQFSFVGFESQELDVSNTSTVNLKLKQSTIGLDEVVAVGYGTQKKVTMSGSVTTVTSKELLKAPVANMAVALIGRTPGLTTYQKSGQPGADGVTLRIRGMGTTNNTDPLILVDGVERDFTQLDANEIESFSILKDASSTAVYGVRGANGVIIVITKKGVQGPAKISITSNLSIQQPTRLPSKYSSVDFARLYNEAQLNDNPLATPTFSASDLEKYASGVDPIEYPNTDWKKVAIKPLALQQQHNITISGGTKKTRYFTSIGYFTQNGLMKDMAKEVEGRALNTNYNYDRFNLRSNVDVDVTNTTKIGVMVSGVIQNTATPNFDWGSVLGSSPVSYPIIYDHKLVVGTRYVAKGSVMAVNFGSQENNSNKIALTMTFNQKLDFITKGLLARGLVSYDSYYLQGVNRGQSAGQYSVVYQPDASGNIVQQLVHDDRSLLVTVGAPTYSRNRSTHSEAAIEYKNSFGSHHVGGLALVTLDKKWYTASTYISIPQTYSGVVGRLTYDYNLKYIAEINLGYNGSENFPANHRFALFPAVSIGWNVSEEAFIKNIISPDILNKLKIRGSYGIVGNDATGGRRFMYLDAEYTSGGGAMFGNSTSTAYSGYIEGKLGNPLVTWETATKQNLGFELAMFKNRFTLNADIFKEDRKDILSTRNSLPIHIATVTQDVFNLGRVKNHGFELEAKWQQDIGKFNYFIGGNYSFARNQIINIDEVMDPNNPNTWRTGRRIGENFGLIADGFFNNKDEVTRGPVMGVPTPGEARYIDVNGDGIVTVKDVTPIGNPEFPEINYGFSFGGGYKGFDISFLFQGTENTSKILSGRFQQPFAGQEGIMLAEVQQERWAPDNMMNASRPKLTLNYANPTSYLASTMWMRDGSYLRLRNVEISYRFEGKQIKKVLRIEGLRLYVNGQNLITWDKLKYIDPEGDTNNNWTYPQLKIFNLGLKVDF